MAATACADDIRRPTTQWGERMGSTFGSFEIAKTGLSVAMTNIDLTGHNITNANTIGYTRQRVISASIEPDSAAYLLGLVSNSKTGQGVQILDIQQLRSSYLDNQYRDLNSNYNYSKFRTESLKYVEGLFNSELNQGEGLTGSIEDFYNALKNFCSDTTSEEYRTSVQQAALSLSENFNVVYEEMSDLWNDQNSSISTNVDAINSMAEQISGLNKAIADYERSGNSANDLRDQRNLLLDKLSGYVDITYANNTDNPSMVDVQIGGIDLVKGLDSNKIGLSSASKNTTEIDAITSQIAAINSQIEAGTLSEVDGKASIALLVTDLGNYIDVSSSDNADNSALTDISFNGVKLVSGNASVPVSTAAESNVNAWISLNRNNLTLDGQELSIEAGTLKSGQLFSNMEMISSDGSDEKLGVGIPYYMNKLNSLSRSIAETINTIHSSGYTYPAGGAASVTGVNFFKVPTDASGKPDYSMLTAGNFTISDEVRDSVWNIAGSSSEITDDSTHTGNSETAKSMYDTIKDGKFTGELNALVSHLSTSLYTSKGIEKTKSSLLNSVETQRKSVSGVSVNEEATNLIVFQQSYNACARVLTTMDEMLDVLISNTGLVGR